MGSVSFLQGLLREERIVKNPVLRGVVMLGYGTLVSKYCVENPSCPAELMKVRIMPHMAHSQL